MTTQIQGGCVFIGLPQVILMQAAQGPHHTEDPLQLPDCNRRRVSPSIICGFPLDLEVWRFRTEWSLGSHLQAKKLQSFTNDPVFSHDPIVVIIVVILLLLLFLLLLYCITSVNLFFFFLIFF